jgi:hypothetical protein
MPRGGRIMPLNHKAITGKDFAPGDCLYRYEDYKESCGYDDEWGCGYSIKVRLVRLYITKRTKKGVWIEGRRFVLLSGRKRYAFPTQQEALDSFIARKKRQILLLTNQLRDAEIALSMAVYIEEDADAANP